MDVETEVTCKPDSLELLLKKIEAQQDKISAQHERIAMLEALLENQKVTEKALCRTQERLRHALEATCDGIWDVNLQTRSISFTPQCYTMLGYAYNEFPPTIENWDTIIHPDDLQIILSIRERVKYNQTHAMEIRIKDKSGKWHWILSRGKIVDSDDKGKPLRMVGTFTDINSRKLIEEALRESEAHLREAQCLAHIGSWNWDVADDRVTWSEELYRIVGMEPDRPAPSPSEHKALMSHKSWVEYNRIIAHTLATGEPFEIEIESYPLSKKPQWLVNRGVAIRDDKGRVERIYGTIQDITEQKEAEEKAKASLKEKEILLKEIHHRVKGNLQAVSSLLNLQANQFREPQLCDAFELLKNRIRAIALVHEKIYTSGDVAHIKFGTHIQSIVHHLVAIYGGEDRKIEMEVDEVNLELSKAIPAALIVNELVTNALIHGFPDGNAGTIKVSLRITNGNNVTLKICDDGKGIPDDIDISDAKTLGLSLAYTMVQQIDGIVGLKRGKGTTFIIKFKLE